MGGVKASVPRTCKGVGGWGEGVKTRVPRTCGSRGMGGGSKD